MSIGYLKGLNTLRFLAAFFVIISHGQVSLWKLGVVSKPHLAIFTRGIHAVEFFFVLSGFLITLLLIKEIDTTQTVSIKHFYLRRVFRIWPLYFLVLLIGFILMGYIGPVFFNQHILNFNLLTGFLLFAFFLSNVATGFYSTGLLHPLWSIGVEEQYYLFWAPFIKLFKNRLLTIIICFVLVSHVWYLLVYYNVIETSKWKAVFLSQRFYAMSVGGLLAYLYAKKNSILFSGKTFPVILQVFTVAVILYHYLIGFPWSEYLWFRFLLSFLYGLLIIFTITTGTFIKLEMQPFTFLGVISYGLYMYHMVADYFLRVVATRIHFKAFNPVIFTLVYQACLIGLSILIANLSYKYFETYFLKLKSKYT
jgi:peptidoglycan/LPS O-acetylase OafA/YrhL